MDITAMNLCAQGNDSETEIVIEDHTGTRTLGLLITKDGIVTVYDRTIGDDILARCTITELINKLI
jgi:hypothetical protein